LLFDLFHFFPEKRILFLLLLTLLEVPYERFRDLVRFWLSRQDSSSIFENNHAGTGSEQWTGAVENGEFGRYGVNVLDVGSLRHTCYDAVIILGVAERQFPPSPRQDPLLLDRERGRLNDANGWTLPLRAQGTDDEALSFAVAIQAANKRLQISFARSEAGSSRSYLPSHFFRAAASALAGRNVEASEVDRLPPGLFTRIPAGTFRLPPGESPLDYHEYDRVLLEHDRELGVEVCKDARDTLPRALEAFAARRSPQLTKYDGLIHPEVATPISWTAGLRRRAISPSRLETYATCPYQFFLRYALQLEPADEPELLERISALDRGSLIHNILDRFLTRLGPDEPPSIERRHDHLRLLFGIASDLCRDLEQQGLVGYRLLWEYDRIEMFEDLEEWYEHEIEDQSKTALRPTTFELRFGPAWTPGEGGEGSRDEPYSLEVDGNELSFQGRVDRVDISPDRSRFRVIDYKTGKARPGYRENTVNGGRALQLPIYLLAASELLDIPWRNSAAEYFFPTRRGDFRRVTMTGAWMDEHWEEFTSLLSSLSSSIESGLFMQIPDLERYREHNCRICDFESICTVNVRTIARRKRVDPRAARFRRLIEADGDA
jgi:ATP-dependent helicase/nuclease subunit B